MRLFKALVLILTSALGLVAFAASAGAQARWVSLSTRVINTSADREVISLANARGAFTALRIDGASGAVDLLSVQIMVSGSGSTFSSGPVSIRAGGSSGPLAQSSEARFFDQIVLVRALRGAATARPIVQIWGLQTPEQQAMVRPARPTVGYSGKQQTEAARKLERPKPADQPPAGAPGAPVSSPPPAPKTVTVGAPPPRPASAPPPGGPIGGSGPPVAAPAPSPPTSAPPAPPSRPVVVGQGPRPSEPPASSGANICEARNICTPVRVFFGTDRRRADTAERVSFSGERARQLQLGVAVVTVPKAAERKRGEIPRPTWFERNVLRVPPDGDPARHFTILRDGFTIYGSSDAFLDAVARHISEAGAFKDHAVVFVHGYNTTFDQALYRTAQISYDLGEGSVPFGSAFLYSWSSGGGVRDYKYDSESARFTVDNLVTFLDLVIAKTNAKHVHLIAHSMGNDAMLNALDRLAVPDHAKDRINQIVLAAPDVDAREFERLAARIVPKAKGVTLFASASDRAMRASRQVHRDQPRAGDVPQTGPVVVANLDSIDVSTVNTDVFSINHSTYADSRELINDVALLFRKGERPPHKRTPMLIQLPQGQPTYWKFP